MSSSKGEPRTSANEFVKLVLKKIFLEDWALKLTALVITLGLWYGVTGLSTPATKRLTVQLAPNVASNTEITNTPIAEVDIVVSGDERRLKPLTSTGLVAALDLTSVLPGDRVISLTAENVSIDLPQGVKLDEIQPSRIAVRLETVEEVELPVKANIEGEPPEGFEIYTESVMPQKVRVRGPKSFMSTLTAVLTEPVSVAGHTEDFVARQVPLGVSNPKAVIYNTVVDVAFRIGEKRSERMFVLPVSTAPGAKRVSVTLFGPRSVLVKIVPGELRVEIAEGSEEPRVVLPRELENLIEVRKTALLP